MMRAVNQERSLYACKDTWKYISENILEQDAPLEGFVKLHCGAPLSDGA